MSGQRSTNEVIRSPLLAPNASESQSAFTGRSGATAGTETRPGATTASAASFDELVYHFTTNSKTLSSEERLGFLKQSKASLEKMESPGLRQSLDQTQRARERARAARATPRDLSPPPPASVSTALRTGTRESLSTNTPLPASRAKRPKGPFLALDEEAMREEQLRKHPHAIVATSPAQIYSQRGDGAVHTPQKVVLGANENPTVLNDFFPEPVRNRQRRRGSYAKYQPADASPSTSARGGDLTPSGSRPSGRKAPSRRASIVVLAVHTPDGFGPSTILHGEQQDHHPLTLDGAAGTGDRPRSALTSPLSSSAHSGRGRRASFTVNEGPSTGHGGAAALTAHPYTLHTRVSSHLSAGGDSTRASGTGPVRSRSAGGPRRQGSFTTGKRAHTPQTRGTFSRNTTPPPTAEDAVRVSPPPTTSLTAATGGGAKLKRRSRRGSAQTPRRGSLTARSSHNRGTEPSPRASYGSESAAVHDRSISVGSASVPMLDVADLHLSTRSAPVSPGMHSPVLSSSAAPAALPPAPTATTPTPRAGARTARTRHLYQAQRSAVLALLNDEIKYMQGADPSPRDAPTSPTATQTATKAEPSAAAMSEARDKAGADAKNARPASPSSAASPAEPIHVEDVSAFPDVVHALQLVDGNASSAYNWVMLAEAMSEAQLLPPHKLRVAYTPDSETSATAARVSPSTLGADAQGKTVRWMGMKEMLVEALNIDNDMKNAWEGLALLLGPDEKVVVRKPVTGRPITVNNVACYIRLLRIEPAYFYGWMGLGCAMVEEQKKLTEEARAAEAETRAMEAMGNREEEEAQQLQQQQQQAEAEAEAAAQAQASISPPPSQLRRGRREPAMTLDDGLRLLEEEERQAKRAAAAASAGTRTSKTPRAAEASRIKASRVHDEANGAEEEVALAGEDAGSDVLPASSIPAVTHDVLFGKRPFEAKDCFAHAVQLCPWEGSIWLQILMALPDAAATVEFDAPADEREWADVVNQRATLEALGADVMMGMPTAETVTVAEREATEATRRRMIALDDDRLLKGCVLSFADVASVALELNEGNKDVWRYVGQRLAHADGGSGEAGSRAGRAPAVRKHTTVTSAGMFVTTVSSQSSKAKRPRRNSMKSPATPTVVAPVSVTIRDTVYTREQCFRRAKELSAPQQAPQ